MRTRETSGRAPYPCASPAEVSVHGAARMDARLAVVLRLKPADDPVPLRIWWAVVALLDDSVTVRRVMEGIEPAPFEGITHTMSAAQDAARAALAELGGQAVGTLESRSRLRSCLDPLSALRLTIRQLARMTVRSQPTPSSSWATCSSPSWTCCLHSRRSAGKISTDQEVPSRRPSPAEGCSAIFTD